MPNSKVTVQNQNRLEGLILALCVSLAFMLLSFLRTLGDTGSMKFGNAVMRSAMETPLWGTALGRDLAYFAASQIFAHLVYGALCWTLACCAQRAWPSANLSRRQWVMLWLLACTVWILIANAALFPASSLGEPYADIARWRIFAFPIHVVLGTCLGGAILACLILGMRKWALPRSRFNRFGIAGAIVASLAMVVLSIAAPASVGQPASESQPNVIIVGIDSMRSDLVFGADAARITPHLAGFLKHSIAFDNATTPLARTFPSWVSILTGKHPHTTGAFINLLPPDLIRTGITLPQALRTQGYRTLYAIDETRFSNVDESYGFDRIMTPPIGAGDFLIGTINDAPLTNLFVNTRIGEWLTPFSYANRAAAMLYDPDTFIARIDREALFDGPTFLAVHFTLMHWPFTWAGSPTIEAPEGPDAVMHNYRLAASRVDQQFGDLLAVLRRKGALENAIVVVLSDHGEALGQTSETNYPYEALGDPVDTLQIYGHGTSVFSPSQYHVLLAMRSFGTRTLTSQRGLSIDAAVSLEDVYPTVMDLLGVESKERFDGESLLPLLDRADTQTSHGDIGRIRFTESEFNPRGVVLGRPISTSALQMAQRYYDVVPSTGRMQIRRQYISNMLVNRQYAAMMGGTIVAAVPTQGQAGFRYFAVDSTATEPREIVGGPNIVRDPIVATLWQALNRRFSIRPGG